MYGIDINFLNDRADRPVEALVPVDQPAANSAGKTPMLIGLGVVIAALAGVGGYWMILQNQQKGLVAQNAQLDGQLAELQQKIAQIDTVRQQTQAIESEIQALAGVFERIRPWSAIVRDVQGRIPTRTQIQRLVQTGADPEGGSIAGGIELGGNACSFDDVNDFMLTLKNSPFLEGETVEITTASLGAPQEGRCPGEAENGQPLELVSYTITSDIKSIPATALLDELNRQQESTGLAARIRALQATGAIE
ncbi:MAG: PilN domain-containing protein [Cyanobacteria bacterium P01_F01_bin.53]